MAAVETPESLESEIRIFLREAREPVAFEPGHDQIRLAPGCYSLQTRGPHLLLEAWDETHNLCRRIRSVRGRKSGSLELVIERFGGREAPLFLLDLTRLHRPDTERRGRRLVFREQVRHSLQRQFPGWTIAELSTERYIEASLGETCVRAFLKKGTLGWAALAAHPEGRSAAGALTHGLVWLDYLRVREPRLTFGGLALFLPENHERATCLRLCRLNPKAARVDVFVYSPDGYEQAVDPSSYSNLATKLEAPAAHTASPSGKPEAVIESAVQAEITAIDGALLPAPVYRQVIGAAGVDRGIVDLLAVERSGRLAILELKASEDIHLPLQALDYWIQVVWHLERGEFSARGFFPGIELRNEPPRLFLVAPALAFHSTTETILRYFDLSIDVVRIGLGVEWRQGPKVMFRIPGARRPV